MSDIFSSITQLGAIVTEALVKILDRTVTAITLLDQVTTIQTSAVQELDSLKKTFQIIITGTAIVIIEVSNNGTNFLPLQPGISASSIFTNGDPWKFYRARVSSITTGSVSVIMSTGA